MEIKRERGYDSAENTRKAEESGIMKINKRRIAFMLLGNVLCGVSVAMFRMAGFGIEPFNLGVMGLWTLSGLFDYGTFYMILSLTLLAVDFFFLDKKKLGIGTVANMFLVGYVIEFAYWIFEQIFLSHGIIVRIVFLILGLLVLCFSSALYYVADLGVSPYDAIPLTIAERSGYDTDRILPWTADRGISANVQENAGTYQIRIFKLVFANNL